MTDLNLDITYQDGLRLSELYGQLGELQYNLEHIDVTLLCDMLPVGIVMTLLCIFVGYMTLDYIKDEYFRKYRWNDHHREYLGWVPHGKIYLAICVAVWVIAWIVAVYLIYRVLDIYLINNIQRDIVSTQMQIDAIKLKYGWI